MYRIPLTNAPNQTFSCKVPVDGQNLNFKFAFSYNEVGGFWSMSLADYSTEKDLLTNVSLLSTKGASANILQFYRHLGIGSAYVVKLSDDAKPLSADNLGTDYCLLWGDTP